jgi:DNA-binding NarL/FixJ family response regulator
MPGVAKRSAVASTDAAEELQELVVSYVQELAQVARAHGQFDKAARLLDTAAYLQTDRVGIPAARHELTQREWQVARLVARGHSNRQIAHELVVSERTVDTHVSHVLRKLDLSSRAQIAAWVVGTTRPMRLLA